MRKLSMLLALLLFGSGVTLQAQDGAVDFKKMESQKILSNRDVLWTQFGPGGAGNNYYIYWHPTDADVVYHGPNMGNSYRSTDRGATYEGILDSDGTNESMNRGPIEISPVEFSRQNPDFGYCSCEGRGFLFVTYDRGLNWVKCENSSAMISAKDNRVNSLRVDPNDDNIWYMGSGKVKDVNHFFHTDLQPHGRVSLKGLRLPREQDPNYVSKPLDLSKNGFATIWKSTNKGKSWSVITPKGIPADACITEIFVHPGNSQKVFAATTYGFYVSENGGKSWTLKKGTGLDNDIIRDIDMHYDAKSKRLTFIAIDLVKYIPSGNTITYNGGLFRSIDEGESWQCINGDMPHSKEFMATPSIKNSFYKLALCNWFDEKEASLRKKYPEPPKEMMHSVTMVRLNPTNPDEMVVVNNYKSQFTFAGGMLWITKDGGNHWTACLRNGTRWNKEDKGYWESRNNPTSLNVTLRGQSEWECRDSYDRKAGATASFNADGSTIMFQFAKVVCVSEDGGETWYENDEIDASDDGSEHWVGAGNSNLPGQEIVQDLRLKDYFYLCAGENSLYRTSKFGEEKMGIDRQSVKKINLPNAHSHLECSVGSMAIDPRDVNTLYTVHFRQGFYGKLMKSVDNGVNWEIQGTVFDVPKQYHVSSHLSQNDLMIDPNYPERFYMTIPLQTLDAASTGKKVKFFKEYGVRASSDGGKTFHALNSGLPTEQVQAIALSPNEKGVLYCGVMGDKGAAGGLYKLEDGATKWKRVKLPSTIGDIFDIEFSVDGKMYISTGSFDGSSKNGGVWCSSDMKRWSQVFPYKIANQIKVAKYDPNVLLVSVPGDKGGKVKNPGIFRSQDGGKSWDKINFGNIQSDRLTDLEIDYFRPGIYWCSTYGAGYYKAVDHSIYK